MRKLLCFALLFAILLSTLAACHSQGTQHPAQSAPTVDQTQPDQDTEHITSTENTTTSTSQAEQETQTQADDGRTVVEIVCPIAGAVTFFGGEQVQDVTDAPFEQVSFQIKRGYVYDGYEIDGQTYTGTTIDLENVTRDTVVTLKLDYITRELPVVHLQVEQEITSKYDYVDVTFDLTNTEDELHGLTGGIRLRGNSTAGFDKKPYRIKFDQKVSLFGLTKAKSWVLLADYLDPSCMHNYTAFSLGAESDALAFTPTAHHVNLYLNGEFMGLYLLCEQVQEQKGRIDIEQTITPDMTDLSQFNFYVCLDHYAPEEPGAKEGETYFYVPWCNNYYSLKYPTREDFCSDEQFYSFFEQLEAYYNKILEALYSGNARKIQKYLDVDSLIDHMIIDQIMGERDHVWKSFYTYQIAGEKLAFGPIWDYDYSLYTPWTSAPNEYYTVVETIEYSNDFFIGVARTPELYAMLCERYQTYWEDVLGDCITDMQAHHASISTSLELNRALWYADKPDIADDNYQFLIKFLKSRRRVLDKAWKS